MRRCANVIECIYTNLDSTAYYKPRHIAYGLLLLRYKLAQHVTILTTVANCNTMVLLYYTTILQYKYNIINLWNHRRICGPSLTET
jgi:hypothetical protein